MYDYSTYYDAAAIDTMAASSIVEALLGIMATMGIVMLIILIVNIIGMWKTFSKAGQAGWKSLIPIYNTITLLKIVGLSPWFILVYLAAIIPTIGSLVVLGFTIYVMYRLAKSFGHGAGFTVGLLFLSPIFYCILGFGKSEYQAITNDSASAE